MNVALAENPEKTWKFARFVPGFLRGKTRNFRVVGARVKLVNDKRKAEKLVAKPNFKHWIIF